MAEVDIPSTQYISGSTALLILFRLSLYPMMADLSGFDPLPNHLVPMQRSYLGLSLLPRYLVGSPFFSTYTTLSVYRRGHCPSTLWERFGFTLSLNGLIVSILYYTNCLPSDHHPLLLETLEPMGQSSFWPKLECLVSCVASFVLWSVRHAPSTLPSGT